MRYARYTPCRHCARRKACCARALCFACYGDLNIRHRYGAIGPSGERGTGTTAVHLPEPTDAPPGSAKKVAVLEDRAANDLMLWHPRDAMGDTG